MTIWIDNQEVKGLGEEFISTDPVNQQMLWQGNAAISKQVKEAITSARLAFFSWKSTPFVERQALVMRFKAELLEQSEHIAIAIAKETGKPLWESRTEVSAMIGKIAISIEAYHERTGNKEKTIANGKLILRHHPLGVMAVLGPYNFPAHLPNGHIIPALLAGNTIVLKPSELTPWVSELIMKIWIKSGLPKGVINLVQGGREVGESLVEDDDINAVLFTGSAKVGSLIHKRLAGKPEKMLALEMGGNNPLIISEHYGSLYSAVNIIVQSAFISAGQRCTCARRVFIPASLQGDLLLEKLIKVTSKLKIGGQFDEPAAFFGALISQQAAEKMMAAQVSLLSLGGKALLDAKLIEHAMVTPAIIDVSAIEKLPDEEYFAPLLQVIRYQNLDQAIAMANDTKFGLSAGLISTQDEEWAQFLEKIQAGVVNRNCPLTGASSELPFGGVGLSGNLRPSAYYAADYCAYPVASMQGDLPLLPTNLSPGIVLD